MFTILAFVVGVVVGAFSHKWLAAEFKTATGLDAQDVASKVSKP